jgi:hypothetical protein
MGRIGRRSKLAAAAAGVTLATSGLSSCHDGGAVDPPPPPLDCNQESGGESLLFPAAEKTEDTVRVTVRIDPRTTWQVLGVSDVTGGTLLDVAPPAAGTSEPLTFRIKLASPTTSQLSVKVGAVLFGFFGGRTTCSVQRTFRITIVNDVVVVARGGLDSLPLSARQRAEIVLLRRDGRTVELEARTPYQGPHDLSWSVSHGTLVANEGRRILWALPAEPGIYQAEVIIDYGPDGLAVDVIMLEVV